MLHLYNTASRTKEPIALPEGQRFLTLYSCGPTVYNYAHIGNLRTYVFEDLLRRTIKYFGFPLIQAMNLTDVDDKTIQGAVEEGTSLTVYTRRYKKAFFEDLKTLRIES
ncbi:MAG: cysteine--tRNA ligase, partial [Chlamydiota bacterium]